ncbi:hypothetical protein FBUS_03513 [Fasciolopsis buskii]|uniref:Cathepsin propeptide inhibitor domain-containing protein n=1 Tax=Fasciolopsis buskii TaxID=27845 RepID=A0A8E0RU91_9TREM|nr:hypothetical protein FBUS_03513 [Fasciolopsis buski]
MSMNAEVVTVPLERAYVDKCWSAWKSKYDKHYADADEDERRRCIFTQSMAKIMTHNVQYDLGLVTYYMGFNESSDLSSDEFRQHRTGLITIAAEPQEGESGGERYIKSCIGILTDEVKQVCWLLLPFCFFI